MQWTECNASDELWMAAAAAAVVNATSHRTYRPSLTLQVCTSDTTCTMRQYAVAFSAYRVCPNGKYCILFWWRPQRHPNRNAKQMMRTRRVKTEAREWHVEWKKLMQKWGDQIMLDTRKIYQFNDGRAEWPTRSGSSGIERHCILFAHRRQEDEKKQHWCAPLSLTGKGSSCVFVRMLFLVKSGLVSLCCKQCIPHFMQKYRIHAATLFSPAAHCETY